MNANANKIKIPAVVTKAASRMRVEVGRAASELREATRRLDAELGILPVNPDMIDQDAEDDRDALEIHYRYLQE